LQNQELQKEAKKNPHGVYKDAEYHHHNSTGNGKGGKSTAPKNGQQALNNSIKISGGGTGRIGVSEGQIVVLSQTMTGVFHGYVVTWETLSSDKDMQDVINDMKKAGLINSKGKTLK
jgi:hypothetical protein